MRFINELKRRNVFKVAAAYIIVGWLIMQAGDTLAPALHLPEWVNSLLAFFLLLGFPLAMFFAWAFEMTPEGIKKEKRCRPLTIHHPGNRSKAELTHHRHAGSRTGLFRHTTSSCFSLKSVPSLQLQSKKPRAPMKPSNNPLPCCLLST